MRKLFFPALLPLLGTCIAAEVAFPRFEELKEPVLFPQNAPVTIDRHGNYCLNGRARFLIGAQIPNKIVASMAPTAGYPESLKWLYEQVIDYPAAQRVGLDTLSYFASEQWATELDPTYRSVLFDETTREALAAVRKQSGLPLQVDFTCAPWSHGLFQAQKKKYSGRFPESVFNLSGSMSDSNHWVPYCLADPVGRAMYHRMWRSGAEELKASGGNALMYELFNEPAYHDPCPANRRNFVRMLRTKYTSVDELNREWGTSYRSFDEIGAFRDRSDSPGLYVQWGKFMEDEFLKLCEEGMRIIREIDPDARFCVQIGGADGYRTLPKNHVNLFEINKRCAVVSTSTGGGVQLGRSGQYQAAGQVIDTPMPSSSFREDLLQRSFFLAIADGKPIHDGETYTGDSYDSLHATLWLQLMRGGNASYLFLWCKRAWDERWSPKGSEAGGRRLAELMSFHILNPWAFPTAGIRAIMDVKEEMLKVDDLFVPRENHPAPEIGLWLSLPTERRAPAIGNQRKNEIRNTAVALALTHYPYGVVLEEQLERFTAECLPVIIASGVRNLYAQSAERVRDYLAGGGILMISEELLPEDEYGKLIDWKGVLDLEAKAVTSNSPVELMFRLPQSARLPGKIRVRPVLEFAAGPEWEVLATAAEKPAILRRRVGKGQVIVIGVRSLDYHQAAIFDTLLTASGRRPFAGLSRPGTAELLENVELHPVKNGALQGLFALNLDRYPKLGDLVLPAGSVAIDPLTGEQLPPVPGGVRVYLPPKRRALVVTGSAAALAERFGATTQVSEAELKSRFEAAERIAAAARTATAETEEFRFRPDLRRTRILDLRKFCNRPFTDAVASDGKGGWTDQGAENSFDGVPWGIQEFRGVPTEILRFDETENRTCIVLSSANLAPGFGADEVRGIPVNEKIRNLYFFHTAAWSISGAEAFHYRIVYADGSTLKLPVVCGANLGEWWIPRKEINGRLQDNVAFVNSEKRGFFIWRWENPRPEVEVDAIDIVSAKGQPIPVVIGITAEGFDPAAVAATVLPLDEWRGYGWFGCAGEWRDGRFMISIKEEGRKDWCGVNLSVPKGQVLATGGADPATAFLSFRINGGEDAWGRHIGEQSLQLYFDGLNEKGEKVSSEKVRLGQFLAGKGIDLDPSTLQAVKIPLSKFFPKGLPARLTTLNWQFTGIAPAAGVAVSELRLENLPAAK